MPRKVNAGTWGEELAASYLRRRFYRILDRGYSCRFGEIDIIAKRGKNLVFVEVKLRKSDKFAEAKEFVDRKKQERILTTAAFYMQGVSSHLQPRFDVIEIYAPEGIETKKPIINHLESAFE